MPTAILIVVAALALLTLAVDCWRWGITPTPSLGEARSACLQLMRDEAPKGTVVELGSGAGGMARAMARQFPHTTIWAIEGSWLPYAIARVHGWMRGARAIHWQRDNFFHADLRACTGAFCYLYPGAMDRLSGKLRDELPPGAWVVSHAFALPDWQPEKIVRCADGWRTPVYLYRVPSTAINSS